MVLDWKGILAIGALIGVGVYAARKQALAVASAVNPINPNNVFYQGANALTQVATGSSTETFGTWLYDKLHNDPAK